MTTATTEQQHYALVAGYPIRAYRDSFDNFWFCTRDLLEALGWESNNSTQLAKRVLEEFDEGHVAQFQSLAKRQIIWMNHLSTDAAKWLVTQSQSDYKKDFKRSLSIGPPLTTTYFGPINHRPEECPVVHLCSVEEVEAQMYIRYSRAPRERRWYLFDDVAKAIGAKRIADTNGTTPRMQQNHFSRKPIHSPGFTGFALCVDRVAVQWLAKSADETAEGKDMVYHRFSSEPHPQDSC